MCDFPACFVSYASCFGAGSFKPWPSATTRSAMRGFTCWGQFVAMLFCQLGRAPSLREICGDLRSAKGTLSHLGITAPSHSTLAYANEHRGWPSGPISCCSARRSPLPTKDRWQVELFFKALKQNLTVKTFAGTSANLLKSQLWMALIAMLLLKYMQLRSQFAWSLSNLIALPRVNLFTHRDLWAWLEQPFEGPPKPTVGQAVLHLTVS